MSFRVPTNHSTNNLLDRINVTRQRINLLQEQIATGKRINRPSDDPIGAELVINLRTSRAEIAQYQRSTITANQKLTAADNSFNNYETNLDRISSLLSSGLSDTTSQTARDALATELEGIRTGLIGFANTRNGDEYLFGGSRQDVPPFDPITGVPAATAATAQYIQVEPGTNALAVGVTAESFLIEGGTTIFEDIDLAVTALRGTGDEVADKAAITNALTRIATFREVASTTRARVGVNTQAVENARQRLDTADLSTLERISAAEDSDFVAAALGLSQNQNSLDAILSTVGRGQRSLIDYLG